MQSIVPIFLFCAFLLRTETFSFENVAGLWHGQGELALAGGTTYFGYWENGLKHGQGTLSGPHGVMYEGEYREGQRFGWGIATYATGERYEGEWQRDLRHGQGTVFRVRPVGT